MKYQNSFTFVGGSKSGNGTVSGSYGMVLASGYGRVGLADHDKFLVVVV